MHRRLGACLLGVSMIAGAVAAPVAAVAPPSTRVAGPVAALATDVPAVATVIVAGGADAVADPTVTVALTTSDDTVTTIRVSLDGASWREQPFAASLEVSLVDPQIGGSDEDRPVTVAVAFGDGATFGEPVTDTVWLDRQAPDWSAFELPSALVQFDPGLTTAGMTDGGSGVAGWRYSFDESRWAGWRPVAEPAVLDFRDPAAGGSWAEGARTAWVQVRDRAGNESPVYSSTTSIATEPYYDLPAHIDYPLPAVTGQLFTARPVLPLGMAPPPRAVCFWRLSWGNHAALYDMQWDASWGRIAFTLRASKGGCGPWTFTLPYAPTLTYRLEWFMCVLDGTSSCQGTSTTDDEFTARWASSDQHVTSSSQPLAYILPSKAMTAIGDPITYTLHTAGGYVVPAMTEWGAQCSCRAPGLMPIVQHGGTSFTFRPDTVGDWPVSWDGGSGLFETVAEFDPAVRRRDTTVPTTSLPIARIGGAVPDGRIPVTVSWTGRDTGWGIGRYQLWKSIDGGAWTGVRLARPKSTSALVWVPPAHSVRFRVRAIDRAGHQGSYDVGPVVRPTLIGDAATTISYAGAWAITPDPNAVGGSLHETASAHATARFTFVGRDVAWIASRGPGRGRATVKIDGVAAGTVDLGASTALARRIVFTRHWSSRATHTIVITVEGTVARPLVGLDALMVLR